MILECLMCVALEQPPKFDQPTETQRVVREMFSKHYGKPKKMITHKRVVINVDRRTDFVISRKRDRFFTVVHYFSL